MWSEYWGWIVFGGLVFVYLLFLTINYILEYPQRKLEREQKKEIDEIIGGLDVSGEKARILAMLKKSLPEAYKCGRKRCDGILLKVGGYHVCTRCHNSRATIKMTRGSK